MMLVICLCWVGSNENAEERVEDAARRFRINTYFGYRTDRGEFDRLSEAAKYVLDAWQAAERPADRADEVAAWLDLMSSAEANSPLPTPPSLASPSENARPAVSARTVETNGDDAAPPRAEPQARENAPPTPDSESPSSQTPQGVVVSLSQAILRSLLGSDSE